MWVGATTNLPGPPRLDSREQAPARPLPASLPAGTAVLSPVGRARHPHRGTSGLLLDDLSPFSCTSPPSPASPRPQLWSLHPKLCQEAGEGSRQPASPTQLLVQGVPWRRPSGQTSARESPERVGQGVRLQQSPTAPAVPSEVLTGCWSGAILSTAALGPADAPVLGAPSLEPGSQGASTIGYG